MPIDTSNACAMSPQTCSLTKLTVPFMKCCCPLRNPIFLSTDVWWTTRLIVEEIGTEPIGSLHLLYWPHVKQTLGIREWLVNTLTLLGTSVSSNSYVLHAHLLRERRGKMTYQHLYCSFKSRFSSHMGICSSMLQIPHSSECVNSDAHFCPSLQFCAH